MNSYGIIGASDQETQEIIEKKWGDNPEKKGYAEQVALITGEYSRNLPKSFNQEKTKKREFRRNAKRTIYNKAKTDIKPVGFIQIFLFWTILSAIVSYFVQKLMHNYFDEKPAGCGFFQDFPNEELEDAED